MANTTTNSTISATDDNDIYEYDPNKTVALVAAALFGIGACIHLFMMIRKKTWFYTAMTVGAWMMTFGYIARYLSIKSPSSVGLYAMSTVLILLAPSLYAATIYMIYGRIVLYVNAPDASIIRPTRVTKIFVIGDVISFLIQAGGGGMSASSNPDSAKLGEKIILVGLFAQLLFFGFFLFVAITFDRRMAKSSLRFTIPNTGKHTWRSLLLLLLGSAAFIVARSVYRVVEFAAGSDGYLMKHEWVLYVGDAAPMLMVQTAYHFIHAGDVFSRGGVGKGDEEYLNLEERGSR